MVLLHIFFRSWVHRLLALIPGVTTATTEKTPALNTDAPPKDVASYYQLPIAHRLSAATAVGLRFKFSNVFLKPVFHLSFSSFPVDSGNLSGDTDVELSPEVAACRSINSVQSSDTTTTLETDDDSDIPLVLDIKLKVPLPHDFHFAGFDTGHAQAQNAFDYLDLDPKQSPNNETLTSRKLYQGSLLFAHATSDDFNDSLLAGSSNLLDLRSDSSLSNSTSLPSSQDSALSNAGSSIVSSAVHSHVSVKFHRSCSPVSWSHVLGSQPILKLSTSSVEAIKDGSISDYVESSYVHGVEPEEPTTLEHAGNTYIIRGMRGKGSFGKVMMAHTRVNRLVAVKVIHKDKQYRYMYGREALIIEKEIMEKVTLTRMPFNVSLLESWADNENVYFVMVSISPYIKYRWLTRI
jgi:hypothetical protein